MRVKFLKNGKAVGTSMVTGEAIKIRNELGIDLTRKSYNIAFETGEVPDKRQE